MTDSTRAALERLIELDKHSITLRSKPATKEWGDAIAAARAALPEQPVSPTDEEIMEWANSSDSPVPEECLDPDMADWQRCFTAEEFSETIRAVLARWGQPCKLPTTQPVPVSERCRRAR